VIYCVVPRELQAELYDRLVAYYEGNPAVTVILDRRTGPDRRARGHSAGAAAEKRVLRDRRRSRLSGTFASTDVENP
jgi:hypothetical protein